MDFMSQLLFYICLQEALFKIPTIPSEQVAILIAMIQRKKWGLREVRSRPHG